MSSAIDDLIAQLSDTRQLGIGQHGADHDAAVMAGLLRMAEAAKGEMEGSTGAATAQGGQAVMDKAKQTAELITRHMALTLATIADEAERVRRGARCLRERCRRLESRARGAEERADITRTASLYAWRMLYEVEFPPFERGAWMRELHGRVATRYGAPFAAAGREARVIIDVLGMWPKEDV